MPQQPHEPFWKRIPQKAGEELKEATSKLAALVGDMKGTPPAKDKK